MSTADLLEAWRDATRAADLADRLAKVAAQNAERASLNAVDAEEVAGMAEQAAATAMAAAERARRAADHARAIARQSGEVDLPDATGQHTESRALEERARVAYHGAEAEARARHGD